MSKRPERYEDILTMSYRWPTKGDRLLRKSDDWDEGIEFSNDVISRHVYIWSGYMRAASMLVDASKGDRPERAILIYPILFNYRHAIELAMKWVITMYGPHSRIQIADIEHHDLWQLWKTCRDVIVDISGDDATVPFVEQVIKDLHDIDKAAQAFRYSRDRNGVLIALPKGLIDLEHIQDVMEAIGHFFDGVDGQLSDLVSAAP
jgi:hypothetical protein